MNYIGNMKKFESRMNNYYVAKFNPLDIWFTVAIYILIASRDISLKIQCFLSDTKSQTDIYYDIKKG